MTRPKWNSIIVDRVQDDCTQLKAMLQGHCPHIKVLSEVSEPTEALNHIQRFGVNLVFCNIEHDGVFDLIGKLNAANFFGAVIFLASDEGFSRQAIRYKAFDFLLKPIVLDDLLGVTDRLENLALQNNIQADSSNDTSVGKKFDQILLHAAGAKHLVRVADIVRLEGDGNYSTVHLIGGDKILVSKPLKYFEEELPAKVFCRVHQSHIVSRLYVKIIQNGDYQLINLSNGYTIPLARRKRNIFLNWLAHQ